MSTDPITLTLPADVQVRRRTLTTTREGAGQLTAALLRAMGGTGRRPMLAPCRWCGAELGARERRAHEPRCERRGK